MTNLIQLFYECYSVNSLSDDTDDTYINLILLISLVKNHFNSIEINIISFIRTIVLFLKFKLLIESNIIVISYRCIYRYLNY